MDGIASVVERAGLQTSAVDLCLKLGIRTAADLSHVDPARDMPWLTEQGLTYGDVLRLRAAASPGSAPVEATEQARRTGAATSTAWVDPHQMSPVRSPDHGRNARHLQAVTETAEHRYALRSRVEAPLDFSGRSEKQLYFVDDHVFLSPISPHPVRARGHVWPTALHFVEGSRHERTAHAELLRKITDPARMLEASARIAHLARSGVAGRRAGGRGGGGGDAELWREAFEAKYTQHPDARHRLVDTGELTIVYHDEDPVWGSGADGCGGNLLGKLLVEARRRILAGELPRSTSPPPFIEAPMCAVCERYPQINDSTWCEFCRAHAQAGSDANQARLRPTAPARPDYPLSQAVCRKCWKTAANAGYSWCQTCYMTELSHLHGDSRTVSRKPTFLPP
eukprot:Rhum_TRINITY_DN13811_c0_g1::Rhum_TRINITY_DN13811_c0_g1_i1::g.64567::m.64567